MKKHCVTKRSPGCGSQRLLRCRSHPAGRGPNSSSLFPPLAAVVAVAPKGEPLAGRVTFHWTPEARYGAKGRALLQRAGPSSYNLSVSLRSTAPLVGEPLAKPFTLRGLPKPPLGRGGGSASALTERLSPAAAHGQASILSFPYNHNKKSRSALLQALRLSVYFSSRS